MCHQVQYSCNKDLSVACSCSQGLVTKETFIIILTAPILMTMFLRISQPPSNPGNRMSQNHTHQSMSNMPPCGPLQAHLRPPTKDTVHACGPQVTINVTHAALGGPSGLTHLIYSQSRFKHFHYITSTNNITETL